MKNSSAKFLIIQTAFIGDVVLALSVAQALRIKYPSAEIHFLLRNGNESLLENHPAINKIWMWEKTKNKLSNLFRLIRGLRKHHFDQVINLHRFTSSGLITWRMKAKKKIVFDKNPLSFLFSKKFKHVITQRSGEKYLHEVERNLSLIEEKYSTGLRPQLYPSPEDFKKIKTTTGDQPYFVIAPSSVWYTKQFPVEKWKELVALLPNEFNVFVIGAKNDFDHCEKISDKNHRVKNLCGQLSLLQSVALIKDALRTFSNDSAPLHFASAMNAPVSAVFCSTIPEFGFGPLSDDSKIVQTEEDLDCRPCGLHGYEQCPKGHFKCALNISALQIFSKIGEAKIYSKIVDVEKRIHDAAEIIMNGGIVIHQTDTIPGFAADATNDEAVKRLFTIKGRKEDKSFILLCASMEMIAHYVTEIPASAKEFIKASGNIPLTLIYPSAKNIATTLQREDGTVAIRIPKHDQTLKLISKTGKPIVSTSANFSGEPAAVFMDEIHYSLAAKADFVLYAEKSAVDAQPSTVVSLTSEKPILIREGLMSEELKNILNAFK